MVEELLKYLIVLNTHSREACPAMRWEMLRSVAGCGALRSVARCCEEMRGVARCCEVLRSVSECIGGLRPMPQVFIGRYRSLSTKNTSENTSIQTHNMTRQSPQSASKCFQHGLSFREEIYMFRLSRTRMPPIGPVWNSDSSQSHPLASTGLSFYR